VSDDGVARVERCECWRADAARTLLASARIPSRYRACGLDTFVSYENPQLLRAVDRARRFVEGFPVVDKGLLLIGPPGIGKTHLAVSVLRAVVLKGLRGLYYDTRSLLWDLRSTYDPVTRTSEGDILQPVMGADLLVLDDLGAERLTDWVEETMHLIVNTRYNEKRPTVFTTNYEDVSDVQNLDSLFVRVGYRLHSRLREMCEFLEYDGPDYRDFEHPPTAEFLYQKWKMGPSRPAGPSAPPSGRLPQRTSGRARARLPEGQLDLGWAGGRAGT
jgi:DNA replication protein DnaC